MVGALKVKVSSDPDVWTTIGGGSFATEAETVAGVLDDRAVTPAGLSAALDAQPDLPFLDARQYGLIGDGVNDDTAALNDAANAARAISPNYGPCIYVPSGLSVRITSTVNLRNLPVRLESYVAVAFTGTPGIIVGGTASNSAPYQISILEARNTTPTPTQPSVRVVGAKNAHVTIGSCDYVQLYADSGVAADNSVGYSQFRFGRKINKLELLGVGTGWINENLFIGGGYDQIILSGGYAHNSNTWIKPSLEASTVTLNVGSNNRFLEARTEGGCTVTFAAGTFDNVIEESCAATYTPLVATATVTDSGIRNWVGTRISTTMQSFELVRFDRSTRLFNASCEYNIPLNYPTPGIRKLGVTSSANLVFDSGLIPMSETGGGTFGTESNSRISRFHLASDAAVWRPTVEVFDVNRVRLNTTSTAYISLVGGWSGSTGTWYTFGSNQASARIIPIHTDVAFVRIGLYTPTSSSFEWMSITAYKQGLGLDGPINLARRQATRPLYQAAAPTRGLAYVGESIGHATGRFNCIARADTTLTVAAAASAATITVASITGINSGDLIGVLLDTGLTHWTTVNGAPAAGVITLTVVMPSAAAIGNDVITNRWLSVT